MQIVSYLRYDDINRLSLTGERLIRYRLQRGVSEIDMNLRSFAVFPISVFNYPQLKHLTVTNNTVRRNYGPTEFEPYYAPNGLVKAHNLLASLELHGSLVFTILEPAKSLESLLPSLTALKLVSNGYLDKQHFQTLPSKLIHLTIRSRWHRKSYPTSDIEFMDAIPKLPRTLQTFDVSRITFNTEYRQTPISDFPPTLTHLRILVDDVNYVLKIMPSTLTDLDISGRWTEAEQFVVSEFSAQFPNLTSFSLYIKSGESRCNMVVNTSFSHKIKKLKLPFDLPHLVDGAGKALTSLDTLLPPSLTFFHGLDGHYPTTNWSSTVPLLQHVREASSLFDGSLINSLPSLPPLLSLRLPRLEHPERLSSLLPSSVTNLVAVCHSDPGWTAAIEGLLNLESLTLRRGESTSPLPLSFWESMKPRLTSLTTSIGYFDSLDDLKGWKRLSNLHLKVPETRYIPRAMQDELRSYAEHGNTSTETGIIDDMTTTENEQKLVRFPSSLTFLSLDLNARASVFLNPVSYLTQLKSLTVAVVGVTRPTKKQKKAKDCNEGRTPSWPTLLQQKLLVLIASVPRDLTNFALVTPFEVSADTLRSLPKTLTRLVVLPDIDHQKNETYGCLKWNDEIANACPPNLRELIWADSLEHDGDDPILSYPPTLMLADLFSREFKPTSLAMTEETRLLLSTRPVG